MEYKQTSTNYHSYLNEIKGSLDPVITKMRAQLGQPWRIKAWIGPGKVFLGYLKHLKVVQSISWASIPIIGPAIVGYGSGALLGLPLWLCIAMGFVLFMIIYYVYVQNYIQKMATIGHSEFHIEAFKLKRPTEYEKVWALFLHKSDFTFEGLYDTVTTSFSRNNIDPSSVTHIVSYTQSQHEFMQKAINESQDAIREKDTFIEYLESELIEYENAITHLVGIIKKVNENLFRYVNDRLSLSDLDFISGFSLYRKEGDILKLIMDKGTSGYNGDLRMNEDIHFAAVVAARNNNEQVYHNEPRPGRNIVSFRMAMLEGEIWIWSFHFDSDDDRSLSLILGNDIIESRQIRRVIHAFCLALQKNGLLTQMEVGQDVEAN